MKSATRWRKVGTRNTSRQRQSYLHLPNHPCWSTANTTVPSPLERRGAACPRFPPIAPGCCFRMDRKMALISGSTRKTLPSQMAPAANRVGTLSAVVEELAAGPVSPPPPVVAWGSLLGFALHAILEVACCRARGRLPASPG